MDLDSLRSFVTVVDCSSLRAAAVQLDMPLVALAAQIDDLEIRVGAPLLQRIDQGGMPTDAGKLVYQDAVRLLASVDALRSRISLPPDLPSGKVSLAVPLALTRVLLAPLLLRVREQLPDVQLAATGEYAEQALNRLLSGQVDFALLVDPPAAARLAWRPLVIEPLILAGADPGGLARRMLVAPAADPDARGAARLPGIRMVDAARLPLVTQSTRMAHRRDLDARFGALGLKPNIVVETDSHQTIEQIVRDGGAYGIAPAAMAAADAPLPDRICARLVEPDWLRTIGLAWLPGRSFTLAQRAVATMIRDQMADVIRAGRWHADLVERPESGFE